MYSLYDSLLAVNRIEAAIRDQLNPEVILQTAADEVGHALNVRSCAVSVGSKPIEEAMTRCYLRPGISCDEITLQALLAQVEKTNRQMDRALAPIVVNHDIRSAGELGNACVPIIGKDGLVGTIRVDSDEPSHRWDENELLLLQTVANQVAVALRQAGMLSEMQQQALTDSLTGFYNRRSFELQLERDLHLSTRMRQPISLIVFDIDFFKRVNDTVGHHIGNVALRTVAETLRSELRAVDIAARFGGDEFAIILPQAAIEGAKIVADRLRKTIEEREIPGYGHVTASFGVATFPLHASSRDTLIVSADRALCHSKLSGRNCVSVAVNEGVEPSPDLTNQSDLSLGAPANR